MIDLMLNWSEWIKPSAGLPTVQWALLLALAAAAGHLLQRYLGCLLYTSDAADE